MQQPLRYQMSIRRILEKISRNRMAFYFVLAGILSVYYTLVSYPGIFYTDTIGRWNAIEIISNPTQPVWLSFAPTLFMMALFKVFGSYASFTLVQSFVYLLSSMIVLDKINTNYRFLSLLILLSPLTIGYSVFGEMSIGCLAGINCLVLLIWYLNDAQEITILNASVLFAAIALVAYVVFGFRQNAFTIFPVLVGYYILKFRKQLKKLLISTVSTLIGLLLVFVMPMLFNVQVYDSSSAGFVWEMLYTIGRMPEEKQEQYADYLDDICGEGATATALEQNEDSTMVLFLWSGIAPETIGLKENSSKIFDKYVQLFLNEPGDFLANKLFFWGRALGITKPLESREYIYAPNRDLYNYGLIDSPRRGALIDNVNGFINGITVLRMPFVWFVLGLLACVYQKAVLKKSSWVLLYLLACFYYGAFMVNTQSFEFRYFFPSYQLIFYLVLAAVLDILHRGISAGKRRKLIPKTSTPSAE